MIQTMKYVFAFISLILTVGLSAHAFAQAKQNTLHSSGSIVVAGGCFWGIQAVFQHTKGVLSATSGYAGGQSNTAYYDIVSDGNTGHAESVLVTYDPNQISLDTLLDVFFMVAHNPTQLNYQGPDHGTQYRSAVFYNSPAQQKVFAAKIASLRQSTLFPDPIVTTIEPLNHFYPAEDYHQNYATLHPYDPYIVINDAPKLITLQKTFPELYVKTKSK
ncbi:MAG: peptide-methionine (S)-S-oxide reductase MsrA [Alphaproteobacteria bacterium]|nr:peptide-methionine (S)-S-oxide reductase MsrA [Alphaproteobacteria bacterium]